MSFLTYNMGNWEEKSYSQLNLIECDDFLKENNFWSMPSKSFGDYPNYGMIIHAHKDRKIWYVDFSVDLDVNEIIILGSASLLMFIKEFKDVFIKDINQSMFFKSHNGFIFNKSSIHKIEIDISYKNDARGNVNIYTKNHSHDSILFLKDVTREYAKMEILENFGYEEL